MASKLPLYTIIADYEGGTYVSQHRAEDAKAAVLQWAVKGSFLIDYLKLTTKQLQRLREDFEREIPTAMKETFAVWCTGVRLIRKYLSLTIVQTDPAA
jgi:hypothetical protein